MKTRRVVSNDGYSLAYDVSGSGPAVTLVPGFMMDRMSWHDVGYVERLASRFTVISVDPLGHGDSDRPHDAAAYADDRLVEHVVAILDAENIDRTRLWGFSRGGTIASFVAQAHPERVDLALLASVPPDGSAYPDDTVEAMRAGDWEPFRALLAGGFDASTLDGFVAANDPRALGAVLRARGTARWRRFEVPVVGYVGDGEPMRDQSLVDAHRLGFPMAALPAGGHMETFNQIEPAMALATPFLSV